MFPKKNRLKSVHFKQTDGFLSFSSGCIKIKLKPEQEYRFAIVVPKKTAKLAVDRNKIKRRVAHIVKKEMKNLKKGYYIFYIHCKDWSFDNLKNNLDIFLKKNRF